MNDLLINKIIGGAGDVVSDPKVADYKDNLYLAVNGDWQSKAVIPADKSAALGSLYAMFKVFNQLAEIYVPVDESGILTLNLNDERYKNVTMGDKQYKVLPVIPARTLLTSLLHSTAQTKQNFDEQNQIQRAPHSSSTPADSEL